jgi:hypothetical protein
MTLGVGASYNDRFRMQVVMSNAFDAFIMVIIALNVLCLTLVHVDMPQWLVTTLFWLNFAFTCIFTLEAAARIVALGFKPYFTDRWFAFDFLVAALSLVQIAIDIWTNSNIPAVNLLRVFRVARIFKLVPKVQTPLPCSYSMLMHFFHAHELMLPAQTPLHTLRS